MRVSMCVAALILVIAIGATACGSNSTNEPAKTPSFQDVVKKAKAATEAARVDISDLPKDWSGRAASNVDVRLSPSCAVLNLTAFNGELARSQSYDFYGPDDQVLGTVVVAFPTAELAGQAIADYQSVAANPACLTEFEGSLQASLAEELGVSVTADFVPLAVPPASGGEPQPMRLTLTVEGQAPTIMDVQLLVRGRMVGIESFSYGSEVKEEERISFAQLLGNKLEEGDGALSK